MWDIWLNMFFSGAAAVTNLYGVRHGSPDVRPLRAAIAALAAFYSAGYLWLLTGVDRREWSLTFSKVALVAWPLVWILPPILGARAHQRTARLIRDALLTEDQPEP